MKVLFLDIDGVLKEESYKGFIATEYEGSSFSHKYSESLMQQMHRSS